MSSAQEVYEELQYYTLSHPSPAFIHQHVVDAYAAQNAGEHSKPIAVVFALVGLYLHVEKGFTGRQVQKAHLRLARHRKDWPKLLAPAERGSVTHANVVAAKPGRDRDEMIDKWCESVWHAWRDQREYIARVAKEELDIE